VINETRQSVESSYKEKVNAFASEIEELKSQLKDGLKDEKTKEMIAAIEKERDDYKAKHGNFEKVLSEREKEWEQKYTTVNNEYTDFKKKAELKSSIPGNFKKEYTKDYIDFKINKVISDVFAKFDVIEKNNEGKTILKNTEQFKQVVADDYFAEALKDVIDTGVVQTGGGGKPVKVNGSSELQFAGTETKPEMLKAIEEHLLSSGISKTDTSFGAKYTELANKYVYVKK
jgi:hypothetical protein